MTRAFIVKSDYEDRPRYMFECLVCGYEGEVSTAVNGCCPVCAKRNAGIEERAKAGTFPTLNALHHWDYTYE